MSCVVHNSISMYKKAVNYRSHNIVNRLTHFQSKSLCSLMLLEVDQMSPTCIYIY